MPQIYTFFPNQPAKAKCVIESLHSFREISFFAFAQSHHTMYPFSSRNLLIECFHGVFFQAIRFDFGLFSFLI